MATKGIRRNLTRARQFCFAEYFRLAKSKLIPSVMFDSWMEEPLEYSEWREGCSGGRTTRSVTANVEFHTPHGIVVVVKCRGVQDQSDAERNPRNPAVGIFWLEARWGLKHSIAGAFLGGVGGGRGFCREDNVDRDGNEKIVHLFVG